MRRWGMMQFGLWAACAIGAVGLPFCVGQSAEDLDKVRFTAIKEMEIVEDGGNLLARVVCELTNSSDRLLVIRNARFGVEVARTDGKIPTVKLDAAEPIAKTEVAPGGLARAAKTEMTVLALVGPADAQTSRQTLVRLFNMVGVRPRNVKLTLDGTAEVGVKKGQATMWEQRTLTFELAPEVVDEALIR